MYPGYLQEIGSGGLVDTVLSYVSVYGTWETGRVCRQNADRTPMLLDITFFDDAVPTSRTLSPPTDADAEAATSAAAVRSDGPAEDVPDWASVISKLQVKLTRATTYR